MCPPPGAGYLGSELTLAERETFPLYPKRQDPEEEVIRHDGGQTSPYPPSLRSGFTQLPLSPAQHYRPGALAGARLCRVTTRDSTPGGAALSGRVGERPCCLPILA